LSAFLSQQEAYGGLEKARGMQRKNS